MRRRDFIKGLGALGVTLGFGSRVISKEAVRLSDEVIQDGADRGLYSQETADLFIEPEADVVEEEIFVPRLVDTPERVEDRVRFDPLVISNHDWSKELGHMLEKDFEVHMLPDGASNLTYREPVPMSLFSKKENEEFLYDEPVKMNTVELDHMYCAFIIKDNDRSLDTKQIADYFFRPALHTFKNFIEAESEGQRLAVATLPFPHGTYGVTGSLSRGGPIPIRTVMMYDVATAGTKVTMDFMAKVF